MTDQSVLGRLNTLEKQNRNVKRIAAIMVVITASLLLMGQVAATRTVEANEFVLRDTKGTVRAKLFMDREMPKLILYNSTGGDGLVLYQAGDTSGIAMDDSNKKERTLLLGNDSGSALMFRGADGQFPVILNSSQDDVSLFLSRNQSRVALAIDDQPSITVQDKDGFRSTLGSADTQTIRTGETSKTSAASLLLFGKDKKVIWKAP